MKNEGTARTISRKPNTIWRLDICYSNNFGQWSDLSVDDDWPTICSCCSRWTSQKGTEYRQQIKTFRLKYIFLAGKIIRTARNVVMKLSENYPYQEIYEKSLAWENTLFHSPTRCLHLNRIGKWFLVSNFMKMECQILCKMEEMML